MTTADRDQRGRCVQIVEFPSHAAAMANSSHPATATFVQQLRAICQGDIVFRNLDVEVARDLAASPEHRPSAGALTHGRARTRRGRSRRRDRLGGLIPEYQHVLA